jgi:hypothetical protein
MDGLSSRLSAYSLGEEEEAQRAEASEDDVAEDERTND